MDLRLSPSGPPIATIGAGMVLRGAEAAGSVSALAVTSGQAPILPSDVTQSFTVELTNVTPAKRYKVNGHFVAQKISATTGDLVTQLQVSYDGGAFAVLRQNTRQGIENVIGEQLHAIDQPQALGSGLLVPVPPAGAASLRVRITVAAPANVWTVPNGGVNGAFWVSLLELL